MAVATSAAPALISVVLSYPRADLVGLDAFRVDVQDHRADSASWVKTVVSALAAAPSSSVVPLFSPEVVPSSVFLDEKQNLYVDFPAAGLASSSAGVELETLTIKALLKSIAATMPEVKAVKFLADGTDRETLFGHVDIRRFFPVRHLSGE
jgi:hypothetical protein